MRIISGTQKRTLLYEPKTKNIRPTTDRAKEALFNLIGLKVQNSVFIDLFSGTGAIALEAKSRGAKEVYAIDKALESIELIQKNSQKSKLKLNIIKNDVLTFLKNCQVQANIIFLDAPFNVEDNKIIQIIDIILVQEILKVDGTLIIERQSKKENEEIFSKYKNIRIKKYGKISFIIME
ncbi:MAG: 16S rRNA (guanine(966)-N(2))-methyltransferase RsmD [Mycoplasmatales bacterium]